MTTNEFLKATYEIDPKLAEIFKANGMGDRITDGTFPASPRPRVRCADGFSVSVQANYSCYCTPRVTMPCGYETVELGYPSQSDDIILEYMEDFDDEPTDTVYGYVPVEVVDKLLEKHGGIVNFGGNYDVE